MIYLYVPDFSIRRRWEEQKTEAMTFTDDLKSLHLNKGDVLFCLFATGGDSWFFINHLKTSAGDFYPDVLFSHPFSEKMLEMEDFKDAHELKRIPSHQLIIMAGGHDLSLEPTDEMTRYLLRVHAFLQEHYRNTEIISLDMLDNLRFTVTMKRNLNQALKYYLAKGKDADLLLNEFLLLAPKTKEDVRRIYHELYDRLVS